MRFRDNRFSRRLRPWHWRKPHAFVQGYLSRAGLHMGQRDETLVVKRLIGRYDFHNRRFRTGYKRFFRRRK